VLLLLTLLAIFLSAKACMGKFNLRKFMLPAAMLLLAEAMLEGSRQLWQP
jgi:hypothetical protein